MNQGRGRHRPNLGDDADLRQLLGDLLRNSLVGRHVARYGQAEAEAGAALGADPVDERPAGIVQQLGGGGGVVGRLLGGAVVGPGDGTGDRSVIGHRLPAEDVADDGSPVDRLPDGLPDPNVLEKGLVSLEIHQQLRILIG